MKINNKWITFLEFMIVITLVIIWWIAIFPLIWDKFDRDEKVVSIMSVKDNVHWGCFEITKMSEWWDVKRTNDPKKVTEQIEANKDIKAAEFFWNLHRKVQFNSYLSKDSESSFVNKNENLIKNWIYLKWDWKSQNDVFYVENEIPYSDWKHFRCWYWIKIDLDGWRFKNMDFVMKNTFWDKYENATYYDKENKILYFMTISPNFFGWKWEAEDLKLPKNIINSFEKIDTSKLWDENRNYDNNVSQSNTGTNLGWYDEDNSMSINKGNPTLPGINIGTWASVDDYINSLSLDEICTLWQLGWSKEWSGAYSEVLKWCVYKNRNETSSLEKAKWWIKIYYNDTKQEYLLNKEKTRLFWTGWIEK